MEAVEYDAIERQVSFFRFQDLRVYNKTIDFNEWISQVIANFPGQEENWLAKKLFESGHSISIFIAEGSSRNKQQFIYYLKMARTSLRECVVNIDIAEKNGYISEQQKSLGTQQLMELTKMLGAMATSIQRMADDEDEK